MFAGAAELAASDCVEFNLETPVSAAEIKQAIQAKCPALTEMIKHSRLAVDGQYVTDDALICAYKEIALIPPVSGG